MIDNKLKTIDFSSSVQSAPMNKNFQVIQNWIRRERLRTGGYGLVEGFDMTRGHDFTINISEGILVDKSGEEIVVPENYFNCGEPAYEEMRTDVVRVKSDGSIELAHYPYSPSMHRLIEKDASNDIPIRNEELKVNSGNTHLPVVLVQGKTIYVSDRFAGEEVFVDYCCCNDRIDAILIDAHGEYTREPGINATSPSEAKVDLSNKYLIGLVCWSVTKDGVQTEFAVNDRTYRKVYVDKLNRLYLNGKVYKEPKWIYFEEPEAPEQDDVWYDHGSNTLSIWSNKDGVWGWRIMNDFTNVPVRSTKVWDLEHFPSDAQTFMFGEDELDYRYIPNTNALEIVIDQQVVMADQFTEVVQKGTKPYLASGIGFKLAAPLDRPAIVQCTVNHVVKNAPLRNVFQRAAVFTNENFSVYATSNENRVFKTDLPYVIGANQLEVFVDGKRLNKMVDFVEMKDETTEAGEEDENCTTHYFTVKAGITPGQVVSYKISRFVWSYDQLNEMMGEIEDKANQAVENCEKMSEQIKQLSKNFENTVKRLQAKMDDLEKRTAVIEKYGRNNTEKINIDDLSSDVCKHLVKSKDQYEFNASLVGNTLYDCDADDFVIVELINDDGSTMLREGIEYTLKYRQGNAIIELEPIWMSPDNTLSVRLLRVGR